MPEITIQYKNQKTFFLLRDLSKYLDFAIKGNEPEARQEILVNGVTLVLPNETVDISNLKKIFSSRKLDANQLRKDAWQRS